MFVPFFACFFGALTYDIFIFTGDSPINNGAWSLSNLRKGATEMWGNILVKFGRAPRRLQSDEESLGARQDQEVPASTPNAEKEGYKISRSSLQDKGSGRPDEDERDGTNKANENTGSESNPNIKNTRKGGYHGEAWEKTEKKSRQGQESGGHGKDHDDEAQETQKPSDDTEAQKKEDGQELEEMKGKETGYDDPAHDAEEDDVGKVDNHSNEK